MTQRIILTLLCLLSFNSFAYTLTPTDACLLYSKTSAAWMTNTATPATVSVGYVCPNGDIFAGLSAGRPLYTHNQDLSAGMFWSGFGTYNSSWSGSSDVYAGAGGAVETCRAAGAGWHLPSKDELDTLYANRAAIGGFQNAVYWSSTETGPSTVYTRNMSSGATATNNTKWNTSFPVRCVRTY
jgi:hypothetical protein